MTTLICWVTYDQNKPASIYLASDSRLSWSEKTFWNNGRKIFYSKKYPDILGYCGDVVFCSQVISQVISYIDECDVFKGVFDSEIKIEIIKKTIFEALSQYPISNSIGLFEIIYITREEKYQFKIYSLKWDKNNGWDTSSIFLPEIDLKEVTRARLLCAIGTGGIKYELYYNKFYKDSDIGGYSRSYFMCLDSFLETNIDSYSGGTIQIAALYTKNEAMPHGLIKNNEKHLYGLKVDRVNFNNEIRWVNECFENCDIETMMRQEGAQIQPKIYLGKKTQRRNFLPR